MPVEPTHNARAGMLDRGHSPGASAPSTPPVERRVLLLTGRIQGVGFRPFVYRLATRHGLSGFVQNQGGGVRAELEGPPPALLAFLEALRVELPPLAHIDTLRTEMGAARGDTAFAILPSAGTLAQEDFMTPDAATCGDCLREMGDPADRRYGYPFINCVNCGPRYTIVRDLPYDRHRTTMDAFPMCDACRAEYTDPGNRRFHAEPIACSACGPRLLLLDPDGQPRDAEDPLAAAAAAIRAGGIGAVKGLGGFHLVCDACNAVAVTELRRRKQRDEKPFAVMLPDRAAVESHCELGEEEAALIESRERPIVLLPKKPGSPIAGEVAPGNPQIGILLPYTPLHHQLLAALDGRPLVMTSGNRSDIPIVYHDGRVVSELGPISDFILSHNRDIHTRCDDSVYRVTGNTILPIRRSRGYAPSPLRLPVPCTRPTLALGGQMKVTAALGRGHHAIVGHHLGDLDAFAAYAEYGAAIARMETLFGFQPELLVHDAHPDYGSTLYAAGRSGREGIPALAVQHHHAHIASCMAENGLNERVIGVSFDGTGYGADRTIWGGEFLLADYQGFERAAHLRQVAMPGGEAAIREPWRMALAHLLDAGEDPAAYLGAIPAGARDTAAAMIAREWNAPVTSSCGRLFDAVAALVGLRHAVNYEGQAAVELEWSALEGGTADPYPFACAGGRPLTIDTRPLIAAIARDLRDGVAKTAIAARFQGTMVEIIVHGCELLREHSSLSAVALSGGVFVNALVSCGAAERLAAESFRVYRQTRVPPNDGGLSLGQLAVAAAWKGGR